MNFSIPPFKSAIKYGRKKAFYSQENSFFISTDLPRYWAYMQDLKKKNPDVALEDFEQLVIDDYFSNLATKIFDANFAFENYMDLQSCKYLISNHSRFNEIYEQVSNPDFEPPVTNETFEDYLVSFVHGCIFQYRDDILAETTSIFNEELLIIVNDDTLSPNDKYKKIDEYCRKNYSNSLDRSKIMQNAKVVCFGPANYLKKQQKYLEGILKDELKTSILSLTSGLKTTGAYKDYEKVNFRNFSLLGFKDFQKDKDNQDLYVDLQEFPEALSTLSIDDLMTLNAYWLNRYIKELKSYSDCLAIVKELKLFPNVFLESSATNITISQEQIRSIHEKMYCLFPAINNYIIQVQSSILSDNIEEGSIENPDTNEKFVIISRKPLKDKLAEGTFIQDYKQYFDNILPDSENDAISDVEYYFKLFNPSIIAYMQKSNYLSALLVNIESNAKSSSIKNAGIIPTKVSKDGTHMELPEFIGVGIDSKLTFPVKEHLRKSFLLDFVKSYNGSTIVPIYEGIDDFKIPYSNQLVSAQLVLPFSQRQIDLLKKRIKELSKDEHTPKKRYLEHLYFLANPESTKLPESILTKTTSPKGKVKKSYIRRYVDLEDGQLYKFKDGNFEKIAPRPCIGAKTIVNTTYHSKNHFITDTDSQNELPSKYEKTNSDRVIAESNLKNELPSKFEKNNLNGGIKIDDR